MTQLMHTVCEHGPCSRAVWTGLKPSAHAARQYEQKAELAWPQCAGVWSTSHSVVLRPDVVRFQPPEHVFRAPSSVSASPFSAAASATTVKPHTVCSNAGNALSGRWYGVIQLMQQPWLNVLFQTAVIVYERLRMLLINYKRNGFWWDFLEARDVINSSRPHYCLSLYTPYLV